MSPRATSRGVGLYTAGALAERLGATLVGNSDAPIERVGPLDGAGARTLTFVRDAKRAVAWPASAASAAIISRSLADSVEPGDGRALLVVDDADLAMIRVLEAMTPEHSRPESGRHSSAVIDRTAQIGAAVAIGPHVVIGAGAVVGTGSVLHAGAWIGMDVRIGESCDFRANVVIEDRCKVGDRVTLHPGVVIGADGFGYRPNPDGGGIIKIPHAGAVAIGDDVEVGANTTIDRGKFGDTVIGAGTKIDNLVQVGHNCQIGRCCIICGAVGIAGSTTIGDGVTIGGGAGIKDNITIGAGAQIAARAGVLTDVPANEAWGGHPAQAIRDALRAFSVMRHLPDTLRTMQKEIKRLGDDKTDS